MPDETFSWSLPDDATCWVPRVVGCTHIATLPDVLGQPTGIKIRNGRVLVTTASGVDFICSTEPRQAPDAD